MLTGLCRGRGIWHILSVPWLQCVGVRMSHTARILSRSPVVWRQVPSGFMRTWRSWTTAVKPPAGGLVSVMRAALEQRNAREEEEERLLSKEGTALFDALRAAGESGAVQDGVRLVPRLAGSLGLENTLGVFMKALGTASDRQCVFVAVEELAEQGLDLPVVYYHALSHCTLVQDPDHAREFVRILHTKYPTEPKEARLDAWCAVVGVLVSAQDLQGAAKVIKEMRGMGLSPGCEDLRSWCALAMDLEDGPEFRDEVFPEYAEAQMFYERYDSIFRGLLVKRKQEFVEREDVRAILSWMKGLLPPELLMVVKWEILGNPDEASGSNMMLREEFHRLLCTREGVIAFPGLRDKWRTLNVLHEKFLNDVSEESGELTMQEFEKEARQSDAS